MKLRLRACEERCLASRSAGAAEWPHLGPSAECPGGALRRGSGPPASPTWGGGWRGFPSVGPRGLRVRVWGHCAGRAQRPFVCRVVSRRKSLRGQGEANRCFRPLRRTTVGGVSVSASSLHARLACVPAGTKEGWEMVARDSGRERVEFQTPPEPRARAWG